MGSLWSGTFALGMMMPFAKVGFPLPMPSLSNDYRKPDRGTSAQNVESSTGGFSTADQKHSFVIKALQKAGILKPRPYIYICLRCKYTFLVNERRGSIVALDRKAQPIPEPENSRRLATFVQGPCPAFRAAIQGRRFEGVELKKLKRRSPSRFFQFCARLGAKTRYPYFVEKDIHAPLGISPPDLLS
jgi:hypothetical protein